MAAVVVVAMLIGSAAGQVTMKQAEYGTGESGRAEWLLTNAGVAQPAQELVMVHTATATAASPGFRAAVRAIVSGIEATGRVQDVRAPAVSRDARSELIQFAIKGDPDTASNRVQPVLDAVARVRAAYPAVTIDQFGEASANKYFNDTIIKDFKRAEWTAVPLALGILLVVFGALVAALLPVVLALTAFFAANGLLAFTSHALHVDTSASSVMLLMGLAVGVDYCLFYLRREQEERAAGRDKDAALRTAAATSGRSVLVSGLTVMVAMAGMFLSPGDRPAHGIPQRAADASVQHADRAELRPHHGGVPRRSRAGAGRGQGPGHPVRRDRAGDRRVRAGRAAQR